MGQNSKQRRDAKKRRQRRPTERSESQRRVPIVPLTGAQFVDEDQGDERSTVELLATLYTQLPHEPSCEGPVLIHQDGAFECHGTCEGATKTFHDDDALAPCGYDSIPTRTACGRCAHLPRGD